jgi:hypothetical protein
MAQEKRNRVAVRMKKLALYACLRSPSTPFGMYAECIGRSRLALAHSAPLTNRATDVAIAAGTT